MLRSRLLPQYWVFGRWRTIVAIVALISYGCLFALGVHAFMSPSRLGGVEVRWSTEQQAWIISNVGGIGTAFDAGFQTGDVVVSVDGNPPLAPDQNGEARIHSARRLDAVAPATGQRRFAVSIAEYPTGAIVLLFSLVFVLVGFGAFLQGKGAAPRALALACMSAACELAILPAIFRFETWAIPFHSMLIPLFFSTFAYLFLVFPIRRRLRIGNLSIPLWMIPFTSIPFGILWYWVIEFLPHFYSTFRLLGYPYLLACMFLGLASLVYSWATSDNPRARVQIRIIVFGSLASITPLVFLSAFPEIFFNTDIVLPKYTMMAMVLMPISFGYAILRYQVMDLQLYVRRGIVYSTLALFVTGIYALILFIATTLVQHRVGMNDIVVLAVSGTIVAILFQRLRDEIQRRIDRLFDRNYYDYRQKLLDFSQQMAGILNVNDLGSLTSELISQTMGPTHVRVYSFDSVGQAFRCQSSVGIPVPPRVEEISARHPLVVGLKQAGGVQQRFDAPPDEEALTILLEKKDEIIGLLVLGPKKADLPYSSEDLSLLKTVANQLAVAADNARLYERTRDLYLSSIRTLAATVDAKDPYTHGHSERVSAYSRSIAQALGLDTEDVESIELAGLLHDIGKIGIPDTILQKPGRLDPDERVLIMEHAALGAKIISENASLMPLAPLVRHHHEWFNGNGYPDKLSGLDIPLGAAIISVADTFDTMTTDRPYRAAPGKEKALIELDRCSGTQFRPEVVEAFLKLQRASLDIPEAHASSTIAYSVAGRISTVDTRAMRIVYRVVHMIGDVIDLSCFIGSVIDLIGRELGIGTVDIFLTDQLSGDLISQRPNTSDSAVKETKVPHGKGLVGWAAEHRIPARVEDTRYDARGNRGRHPKTRSHLVVPLVIDENTIGVIDVQSRREGAFTADDETLLVIVAQQLAQIIEVAQLHDQLKKCAILDGMTGVANHRYFYQRLEEELVRSQRTGDPVSLLLIDVDGLKRLNDTHGHVVGDDALRTIASTLEHESRATDVVARYGGDEFAIILPSVDEAGARAYATRVIHTLSAATFAPNGEAISLPSVSWGSATLGADGDRAVTLVAAADARMYQDKFALSKTPHPVEAISKSG